MYHTPVCVSVTACAIVAFCLLPLTPLTVGQFSAVQDGIYLLREALNVAFETVPVFF